jgi:hypothetical protein
MRDYRKGEVVRQQLTLSGRGAKRGLVQKKEK